MQRHCPLVKTVVLRNRKTQICFTFLLTTILLACSTQKSKDDVTAVGKLYHNTTAQYNGYFNADVIYQQSILNLESQVMDNYLDILPLYKYTEAENPLAEGPILDNAIEKVTIVVSLHRVSDWTDDCYLLMGKAQYLKQDYESSMETLEFLAEEYSPSAMEKRKRDAEAVKKGKKKSSSAKKKKSRKKKKKRRRKPKRRKKSSKKKKRSNSKKKSSSSSKKKNSSSQKSDSAEETDIDNPVVGNVTLGKSIGNVEEDKGNNGLKNAPAYFEGLYWLSRNYIDVARYSEATRLMDQLSRSKSCPSEIKSMIPAQMAYLFHKKRDYETALTYLSEAIALEKDKFRRARLLFIAGQMSRKLNNQSKANDYFNQVVNLHPNYELEFNALLLAAQTDANKSKANAVSQLERMLKEEKNLEYQDQIYYVLADVYLKDGDIDKGIENLRLSINSESRNAVQKAESAYRLAMLYYEQQDYVEAKNYFDLTLSTLSKKDDRYNRIRILSESLEGIAKALNTIQLQDSLIRIYNMSEEEKMDLAQRLKDEQEAKRIASLKGNALGGGNASLMGKSDFYAYDSKAVKRGIRDFQNKWGDRPLEDNWRRADANQAATDLFDDLPITNTKVTEEEMKEMFKNVPANEQQLATARKKIVDARLELGKLYRSDLEDPAKAAEILQQLLLDIPKDSKIVMEAYYFLYLSYLDLEDSINSKKYYDLILKNYPNSPIATAISDPNFGDKKTKDDLVNDYYEDCYQNFKDGQYTQTLDKIAKVPGKFGSQHKHHARFGLLKAFCIGKMEGREKYIEELKTFLIRYPNTPEEKQVRELLRILGSDVADPSKDIADTGDASKFIVEFDKVHYIIVTFADKDISLTETRNAITSFNSDFFSSAKLRSSNISLGAGKADKTPIIVIRRFADKEKALAYVDGLAKNGDAFLEGIDYTAYAVSQSNYRTILKDKTMDGYPTFYEENY